LGKGRVYTPAKTKEYENTVAWAAKAAMMGRPMIEGPVQITMVCCFSAKSRSWHVSKPDLDNCAKSVIDGLVGVVLKDDCQVSRLILNKFNSLQEGVTVDIEPLPPLPNDN
jgi:Holliday junction resolvase RusA-like endonuclease